MITSIYQDSTFYYTMVFYNLTLAVGSYNIILWV